MMQIQQEMGYRDAYPYITEDNLEHTQAYNYTAFDGVGFMRGYLHTREQMVALDSVADIDALEGMNKEVKESLQDERMLRLLIKTFEVNKRLYERYDYTHSVLSGEQILKPDKHSSYQGIQNYLGFAYALGWAWKRTQNLLFLNTLLKLNDTLLSLDIVRVNASRRRGGGGNALYSSKHFV